MHELEGFGAVSGIFGLAMVVLACASLLATRRRRRSAPDDVPVSIAPSDEDSVQAAIDRWDRAQTSHARSIYW